MRDQRRTLARGGARVAAITVLAIAGSLVAVAAAPAPADEGGVGLTFTLGVDFSQFPCPAAGFEEPCTASVSGVVSGQLAGVTGDRVWELTMVDAAVSGSLTYGDDQARPCAAGTTSGSLSVSADDLHVFGAYEDSPLPRLISGLTAGFDLEWIRAATALEVAVRDAAITIDVVGLGPVDVISTGQGEGVAELLVDAGALDGCLNANNAAPASATVTGRSSLFEDRVPDAPTLLEPHPDDSPYQFGQPEVFRIVAVDPDGEPYQGLVTVWDALTGEVVTRFETRLVPSGAESTGRPVAPLASGTDYLWSAEAIDVRGGKGAMADPALGFTVEGGTALLGAPLPVTVPVP